MEATSLKDFYKKIVQTTEGGMEFLLPNGLNEFGHFNVIDVEELVSRYTGGDKVMPYNRKLYYKISLVCGKSVTEYADKVITIEKNALVFGTPKIPYHYLPEEGERKGNYFCVFTADFLMPGKTGLVLDELPIFKPGGYPVFEISDQETEEIRTIMKKMYSELSSDYAYKDDLLRNYLMELIHYGQKLQPMNPSPVSHNASSRVSSLFMELLERQFPIDEQGQKVNLRSAKDYADRLAVHINHLNKVLKESTGKTTTELINGRLIQEAKILLKHSDWNISEIAYSLGFEQLSHFSSFFKKQTSLSPNEIRSQSI